MTVGGDGTGSGKDSLNWKNYARIIGGGSANGRKIFEVRFEGKTFYRGYSKKSAQKIVDAINNEYEINDAILKLIGKEKSKNMKKASPRGEDHPLWRSDARVLKKYDKQRKINIFMVKYKSKVIYNTVFEDLAEEIVKMINNGSGISLDINKFIKNSIIKNKSDVKNKSGILHVFQYKRPKNIQGFTWKFEYKVDDQKISMQDIDLLKLKEKVLLKGFDWIITDEEKYKNSLKINKEGKIKRKNHKSNNYIKKTLNKSGIYQVYKSNTSNPQGFIWVFECNSLNKRIHLSSVDLLKLKKKVMDNGLDWIITDENKYKKSLKINEEGKIKRKNYKRKPIITSKNSTGYYRTHKCKSTKYKQGFFYRYQYKENKKQKYIESADLKKLEKKVRDKGLPWFKS